MTRPAALREAATALVEPRTTSASTSPSAQAGAPTPDPRMRAWLAFLQAHAALSRRLEAELQAVGRVSLAEYDALVQLAAADQRRLRMSELADRVVLSRSGISRLLGRLEARGWAERSSCPTDARGAWANLTPAGLDTLREATPVHLRGIERHFLAPMDDADQEALARALDAVLAGLGGQAAAPPAGGSAPAAPDAPPTGA